MIFKHFQLVIKHLKHKFPLFKFVEAVFGELHVYTRRASFIQPTQLSFFSFSCAIWSFWIHVFSRSIFTRSDKAIKFNILTSVM